MELWSRDTCSAAHGLITQGTSAAARSSSHATQRQSITSSGAADTAEPVRAQNTGHISFSTVPSAAIAR